MTWAEAAANLGMTLTACVTIIICVNRLISYFKSTYEDDE